MPWVSWCVASCAISSWVEASSSPPRYGVEHGRVGSHLLRVPETSAVPWLQDGDPRAEAHYELHVVLDDQDRLARAIELLDAIRPDA